MFFGDFNKTILVIDAKVQEDLHRPEDKKSASRYWWRCVIARFFFNFYWERSNRRFVANKFSSCFLVILIKQF
jgi:hypothetical protein